MKKGWETRKKNDKLGIKPLFSEHHRKALSKASRNQVISEEQKRKISQTLKEGYASGRISKDFYKTQEHREKMKKAALKAWKMKREKYSKQQISNFYCHRKQI